RFGKRWSNLVVISPTTAQSVQYHQLRYQERGGRRCSGVKQWFVYRKLTRRRRLHYINPPVIFYPRKPSKPTTVIAARKCCADDGLSCSAAHEPDDPQSACHAEWRQGRGGRQGMKGVRERYVHFSKRADL